MVYVDAKHHGGKKVILAEFPPSCLALSTMKEERRLGRWIRTWECQWPTLSAHYSLELPVATAVPEAADGEAAVPEAAAATFQVHFFRLQIGVCRRKRALHASLGCF